MIPVRKVRKPKAFDVTVKQPGEAWLVAHPAAKRPKPLWDRYTKVLSDGFSQRCGYAAMLDPTGGSVDHYMSCRNYPSLAYEWSNYRFASATLNSSKKNEDDKVLDPYQIGPDWFEILLPSLQMRATSAVPAVYRDKAEHTLTRLRLRDGERIIRWRKSWYDMYSQGKLTLDGLRQVAPLIADAVVRQGA